MIKAIFFDIDGTLLNPRTDSIPDSTMDTLHKLRDKDIKLFIATGRNPDMVIFLEELFPFDGFLALNGQYCYDREGVVLHKQAIEKETLRELLRRVEEEPFPCLFNEEKQSFMLIEDDAIRYHFETEGLPLPELYNPARLDEFDVLQFLIYYTEKNARRLEGLSGIEITSAGDFCFDVMPIGGGKHTGIAAVAAHYGFTREETMAFGDGDNDAAMLRYAGIGVAMGNAVEGTKKAADYVTAPVWDGGIAKAAKHFRLI